MLSDIAKSCYEKAQEQQKDEGYIKLRLCYHSLAWHQPAIAVETYSVLTYVLKLPRRLQSADFPSSPVTSQPGGPVDAPVKSIADKLGTTSDQVLLAWAKAKGAVVVT